MSGDAGYAAEHIALPLYTAARLRLMIRTTLSGALCCLALAASLFVMDGPRANAASTPARLERSDLLPSYLAAHWEPLRERLEKLAEGPEPSRLYDVQLHTNLLLEWAIEQNRKDIVDQIIAIYMRPLHRLEEKGESLYYNRGRYDSVPSTRRFRAWYTGKGNEPILSICQFLYAVVRALHAPGVSAEALHAYAPVLRDHYTRWVLGIDTDPTKGVFQREPWGCLPARTNQLETVTLLVKRGFTGKVSYCNAVNDFELWIVAGAVEFLALDTKYPRLTGLTDAERSGLQKYVQIGTELIRSRSTPTTVDVQGRSEPGLLFDPGSWRDHDTMRYAGVRTDVYPTPADLTQNPTPSSIAYDISHARRFVQLFESLHRHRDLTGATFPSSSDMRALANQLSFRLFNGDYMFPRFANFIDGSNGWFEIGYSGRRGFGYPPFGFSNEWISSGYCRLETYQPAMRKLCDAILEVLRAETPQVVDFRENKLRKCVYSNFAAQQCAELDISRPSFYVLNFLSSLRR